MWLWLRVLVCFLFQLAPVPRHVAFIMDGNRRYADKEHVDKLHGHTDGYQKLVDVIHWCLELGVKYITVYAFSIDNFQRSPEEVGALMQLAESKYHELAKDKGLAEREGIEIRVLGNLSLAPSGVQGAAARLMEHTAAIHNKRGVLQICFSYTATEELLHAVEAVQSAVASAQLLPQDVTFSLVDGCLYTGGTPPVDLMIRTSGESRLSDFVVRQSQHAHLCFIDRLWPELGFLDLLRCVFGWQRSCYQKNRRGCQRHNNFATDLTPTANGTPSKYTDVLLQSAFFPTMGPCTCTTQAAGTSFCSCAPTTTHQRLRHKGLIADQQMPSSDRARNFLQQQQQASESWIELHKHLR